MISKPTLSLFKERFELFNRQIVNLMNIIQSLEGPICGFGAAQMLPTLAYHMQSDLSFLECIWDDNPNRNGLTYPHLPVRIHQPKPNLHLSNSTVMITALDSTRPIISRLNDLNPRYILKPLYIF